MEKKQKKNELQEKKTKRCQKYNKSLKINCYFLKIVSITKQIIFQLIHTKNNTQKICDRVNN